MSDWQDRVRDEAFELEQKILKLRHFLNELNTDTMQISITEYCALNKQLYLMDEYYEVLTQRIERFE